MSDHSDMLLALYNEHVEMARQHETQRSTLTSIILTISGVLIGFAASFKLGEPLIIPIILIFLGVFGAFFCRKHYERNRYHTSIAAELRHRIDPSIDDVRRRGAIKHYIRAASNYRQEPNEEKIQQFMKSTNPQEASRKASSRIAKYPLHIFWEYLNLVAVLAGVVLLFLTIYHPPELPTKIDIVSMPAH
jgi:hypothetical protein